MKHLAVGMLFGLVALSLSARADDRMEEGQAPPQMLAIGKMPKPPVLDGKLADWPDDSAVILLGQTNQTLRRAGKWSGTPDSSAAVRLAWDAEYLYFAAEVADDKPLQAGTGAEPWQGDTFELFFNIHPQQQRMDGFWQIALIPPLKEGAKLTTAGAQKLFDGFDGTAVTRQGGYTLECRIPWKNLEGFAPEVGRYMGLQIALDDRDDNGRKSQFNWYPSAITFAHPTHTNTLILRDRGDTSSPRVIAGPQTWCVTDAKTMSVSALADVPGAKTATIAMAGLPGPIPTTQPALGPVPALPEPVVIELQSNGRSTVGKGTMKIEGLEGPSRFDVVVRDEQGRTLASSRFEAQLTGRRFARMQEQIKSAKDRIAALTKRGEVDETARAGLTAWLQRCIAFQNNEAQTATLSAWLLDQMLVELNDIEGAIGQLEQGKDPYAGRTGSFVRAYRSPLTGELRSYALYIPEDYKAGEARPLLVVLHAIFADERQLVPMVKQMRDLGAIVYQAAAYRQFDWGGISAAETWAGLDDLQAHYKTDADRTYLMGCHIGGRGTWQLAMTRPDLWAAAGPLYSGIDTRPNYPALRLYPQFYGQATRVLIPPPQFKKPPVPEPVASDVERKMLQQASLASRAENISALPLRSAYGEEDPDAGAERLALEETLSILGHPLATRYAPGAMHGNMASEWGDPQFYRWLLSHKRQAYPREVTYVANGLRHNQAWWVRVDALTSPVELGCIEAQIEGDKVQVKTAGVAGLSLVLDERLAKAGTQLAISIDGQNPLPATVAVQPAMFSVIRNEQGKWAPGSVPAESKHHGLSGPIDDFQFSRLLFVYGTGGDAAQNTAAEKRAKGMADWGLGTVFPCKADRDVTDIELRECSLLLIGTPQNNDLLKRMADRLPIRWTASGLQVGDATVEGPGAGACVICPNPLSPQRYVVVITGIDDIGYQAWSSRAPGGDYVLGRAEAVGDAKPQFKPTARGFFDNQWRWSAELCIRGK